MKFLFSILFFVISAGKNAKNNKQPNIILILTDDLGWSDVSWNNENIKTTPFMNKMVQNGTRLTQSYSTHRCSPTRASILTGRYPWRYGLGTDPLDCTTAAGLDVSEKLIPELLKQKDEKWKPTYSTHMVGKWHLGSCSKELLPINRGFDSFYGHYGGAIDYYQHTKNVEKFKYLDYFDGAEVNRNKTGIYSTYDFGEETRRVFKQVNEPKFIYLAYNAPHDPVSAPEQLIEDMKKFHPGVTESRAKYLASVKAVDEEMEKLVETIREKNESRDTIIIFQSDNGGTTFIKNERHGCNYPYKGEKTLLTEGGTLVPAFIYSIKNTIASKKFDGIFHVTDWFPTILKLAKKPKKTLLATKAIDGLDQSRILTNSENNDKIRNKMIYGMIDGKSDTGIWETTFAMRIGNYKFYNYKLIAQTVRCEEGYRNDKIESEIIENMGIDGFENYMKKLLTDSVDIRTFRTRIKPGFSVFDISKDPYELEDLAGDEELMHTLAAELKIFELPTKTFADKLIQKEKSLGHELPITGARYTFWKSIFTFMNRTSVLDFMLKSGRLNSDSDGLYAGTDYCDSPEDGELLSHLIGKTKKNRKTASRNRLPFLKKLISRQFETTY